MKLKSYRGFWNNSNKVYGPGYECLNCLKHNSYLICGTRASTTRTLSTITFTTSRGEACYVRQWPLQDFSNGHHLRKDAAYISNSHQLIWPMTSLDVVGATKLPFVLLRVGTTSGSTRSCCDKNSYRNSRFFSSNSSHIRSHSCSIF